VMLQLHPTSFKHPSFGEAKATLPVQITKFLKSLKYYLALKSLPRF